MIQRAKALDLPEIALPLDPYFLGVWLGDGNSRDPAVTCSEADMPWMRAEIERIGYRTTNLSHPTRYGVLGVRAALVTLGLLANRHSAHVARKHIPQAYLRSSIKQRTALLQGLTDTDGTVSKNEGYTTFCNTNLELAEGVRELVRSLGVKAGWSERRAILNGKDCGPAYNVTFYMAQSARLPRKAALCRNQKRTPQTYIDVVPAGNADTICIEVDSPSHLFLCGRSMTPTHNSRYASILFPLWLMARTPDQDLIGASYYAELAEDFSFQAIRMAQENANILGWTERLRRVCR